MQTGPSQHARSKYLPLPVDQRRGIALCLSGGGSRAALFELGVVRRLNEVGILSKVETISGVSGGSILAAHLIARMQPWPAVGTPFERFDELVARPFEAFVRRNLRPAPVLKRLLPPTNLLPSRDHAPIEAFMRLLERYLTDLSLAQLPAAPRLVISATDDSFGVGWHIDRERMGNAEAGYGPVPADWTLARAVAASSCFPPAFSPMPIRGFVPTEHGEYPDGEERDRLLGGLRVSDGGIYDNLAVEPVWRDHRIVIAVDGGSTFDPEIDQGWFWRIKRFTQIQGRQVTDIRKRWMIQSMLVGHEAPDLGMEGAYIGIGSDVAKFETGDTGYDGALVDLVISEVRTDLDAFSDGEIGVLQNHGYQLAVAAVRKHLSNHASVDAGVRMPYPAYLDGAVVTRELRDSGKHRTFGRGRWWQYLRGG